MSSINQDVHGSQMLSFALKTHSSLCMTIINYNAAKWFTTAARLCRSTWKSLLDTASLRRPHLQSHRLISATCISLTAPPIQNNPIVKQSWAFRHCIPLGIRWQPITAMHFITFDQVFNLIELSNSMMKL